jgi:hypothetical protein
VTSNVTLPRLITYVEPDLQAQDGTFFGIVDYDWSGDDFLASFDRSGNVKWSNLGYYAQIATSGGGVIGQSYSGQSYTFDANGNSTGQTSLPTQSWLGNQYKIGSVEQVALPGTDLASAFAVWPWGGSNTATKQQWYPPLASCTNAPGCIGPNDAIYNALADLVSRLQSPTIVGKDANGNPLTLGGLAQSQVFNKLGSSWTTAGFVKYLAKKPGFYNALNSSYCELSLLPGGDPCLLLKPTGTQTVSEYFNSNPKTDALTDTPSNPLVTFFRPTSILLQNSGMNLGNESTIFHEALHGWTKLNDSTILENFYGSGKGGYPTCYISVYIGDDVLLQSPGLDSTHSSCP